MVFYLNKDTVNQDEKEKNSENVFLFLNKKGEIELIGHRLRVIVLSRCSKANSQFGVGVCRSFF